MVFGIPEKQKESTERKFNSFFRKREKTSLSTKVEKEKKNATEGHGAYLVNFFNDSNSKEYIDNSPLKYLWLRFVWRVG